MKPSVNISLERLLRNTTDSYHSELDKIIGFYKTILELERIKEPDIAKFYPYTIHFKDNDSDVMLIDLPCNPDFTNAFNDNRNSTFPKDLYVGLPIILNNKIGQVIVFSLTIDYTDLKGYDPNESLIPIRISNLSVDSRLINELELTEEELKELEVGLAQVKSIDDLRELVRRQLGEDVELKMELQLGLSSKNIALAQISSELNRLSSSMVEKNELLKSFLTYDKFDNLIAKISADKLIPVSPLDESQAFVVAHALSNRFTVVTGAPGTGKTQVILNIIANALMRDKSVLIASKNNKAVDNVKERFDKIDSSQYLLRFGRKEHVERQTVPALSQILNWLNALQNQPDSLSASLSDYRNLASKIKDAKKISLRIKELKILIPQVLSDKSSVKTQIETEYQRFASEYEGINKRFIDVSYLESVDSESISLVESQITRLRNFLQSKYSGISGVWHNLFSKKKHAVAYLGYIEDLPYIIRVELRDQNLTRSTDDFKDGKAIIEHSNQVITLLERICDWQRALQKENTSHSLTIDNLSSRLTSIERDYNARADELEKLTTKINRLNALLNPPESLSALLSQYRDLTSTIKDAERKLLRIGKLENSIKLLLSDKSNVETQIETENQRFASEYKRINKRYSNVSHLEDVNLESISQIASQITRLRNYLQSKYTGISGIWHNLFSKKEHAVAYLDYIEDLPSSIKAELRDQNLTRSTDDFKDGKAIIEHSRQVISLLERICDWQRSLKKENAYHSLTIDNLSSRLTSIERNYNALTGELGELIKKESELKDSIRRAKGALIILGKQLVAAKILEIERGQGVAQKISSYKSYLPDNIPWKDDEIPDFICKSREFLSVCRLISVTSLSVKGGFPLVDNLFDILIIDEASQCDIASAIPLILRAKQVVIIGDPKQLKHITSVKVEDENIVRVHFGLSARPYLKYAEQSLWDYAADFLAYANQNSSPITLENHYRCHHDIIDYSNHQFYSRFLAKPLNVMTDESNMTLPQKGIVMINVHGKQESENVNINKIEAERAISVAKEVCSLKADVSIGIVTPFRDQADYIKSHLDDSIKGNVEVNTAHGFQGDEKDVIIYSLVVTDNSPRSKVNWIDYMVPNLVNVAVTRARQTLYIVGNADYIKAVSPEQNALGYLIRYAQSKIK